MKVLKSGVEMTPEEMRKSRGGMCACGCAVGINSLSSTNASTSGSNCACQCEVDEPIDNANTYIGAWKYMWIY